MLFANLLSQQNGWALCYFADSSYTIPIDPANYTSTPIYCDFDAPGYRLMTEGEWEHVCRAGTTATFPFDENNYTASTCESCNSGTLPVLEQYAVFCANPPGGTAVSGSKLSNQWNIYDLQGNVLEWCWDWYGTYPGNSVDYQGINSGYQRVFRGGGWDFEPKYCRPAARGKSNADNRNRTLGFRLVRSVNDE